MALRNFILLLLATVSSATGQSLGPYEVDNKGTIANITLGPAEKNASNAVFYMLTDEPSTNPVELYVKGAVGTTATLGIGALGSQSAQQVIETNSKLYQVEFRGVDGVKRKRLVISPATNQFKTAKLDDSYNACINSPQVQEVLKICAAQGVSCSPEQLCGGASTGGTSTTPGAGNPTGGLSEGSDPTVKDPADPTQSSLVLFHFHKDMCGSRNRRAAKHIAVITVDLSAVDKALFDSGFTLSVGLKEYEWEGGRKASVKPMGDGMIRQPLLMSEAISAYSQDEHFNIVSWAGGRIRRITRVPIGKWAPYRGLLLSVAGVARLMNRQRSTVAVSNEIWTYSPGCVLMAPTRQYFNGYTN